jgi:ABC-type oligopeptide transport system substrate-binding subunit
VRHLVSALLTGFAAVALVACGGDKNSSEEEGPISKAVEAACNGSALSESPKLPANFPKPDKVTYTHQEEQGPTDVVEGYYEGDVADAYNDYKSAFESANYTILFDELEEHDSEVSWKNDGRSGQVALREECGEDGKTYVHITNRPAG